MGYNWATTKMARLTAKEINEIQGLYYDYSPVGEIMDLDPEEVVSIEVVKNEKKDTAPIMQSRTTFRSSRSIEMTNMLRTSSAVDDMSGHINHINVLVVFKTGRQWFGLCDAMKPLVEAGKVTEGLKVDVSHFRLQKYTHPSTEMMYDDFGRPTGKRFPDKLLATILFDEPAQTA